MRSPGPGLRMSAFRVCVPAPECMMEALLVSTLAVALAEIGDKTQLLALVLAARYRRPGTVVAGIALATLLNHALAAAVGAWLARWLGPEMLRWAVVLSFAAVALWTLVPDQLEEGEVSTSARGAFIATLLAFFLVEIGDKTQVATVVLAAQYTPLAMVVLGTTLGMLIANAPVVWLGARFAHRLPLRAARFSAAALFALLALWVAWQGLPS